MKRTDITALFPNATEDQIKTLMDINGQDINAAKQGVVDLQSQLESAKKDLEAAKKAGVSADDLKKAQDQAAKLEKELNDLKTSNQIRDMRANVAKEKGIPADLLTGDTEEACKAQADGILAFAKPNGYPKLPDGGEPSGAPGGAARDKFAAWAAQAL